MNENAKTGRRKDQFTKGAGRAAFWLWALVMVTSALTSMGMSAASYGQGMVMLPAYSMAVIAFLLGFIGGKSTPRKGDNKPSKWAFLGALWVTGTAASKALALCGKNG